MRCDNSIYTFGFSFHPWYGDKIYPQAAEILQYIIKAAETFDILKHIRCSTKVKKAEFDSNHKATNGYFWKITSTDDEIFRSKMLFMCSGFYQYDNGYVPDFVGLDKFKRSGGKIVHAQAWDDRITVEGKSVAVIGSGATAITIIPALVKEGAKKVTMIQRSPAYISGRENIKNPLIRILPYWIIRTFTNIIDYYRVWICMILPRIMKTYYLQKMKRFLPDHVIQKHFIPQYDPWRQRLCVAPDNDFWHALNMTNETGEEIVSIRTGQIESFTDERSIRMKETDDAQDRTYDIVILATGFNMQSNFPMSDVEIIVNGRKYIAPEHYTYKGSMLSDVPNFFYLSGYRGMSYTVKSERVSKFMCDVLSFMDKEQYDVFVPEICDNGNDVLPCVFGIAGYLKRSFHLLPKQNKHGPWKTGDFIKDTQYFLTVQDKKHLHFRRISSRLDAPEAKLIPNER